MTDSEQPTRPLVPPPPIPVGGVPPGDVRLPWYAVTLGGVLVATGVLGLISNGGAVPIIAMGRSDRGSLANTVDIVGCLLLFLALVWRLILTTRFQRLHNGSYRMLRTSVVITLLVNLLDMVVSWLVEPSTSMTTLFAQVVVAVTTAASFALTLATVIITRRPEVIRAIDGG